MNIRPIIQSEAAECGLAVLAMIVGGHGVNVDLREMRRRFPTSIKGAKLSQLIHIAQDLGFMARPLRLDIADLKNLMVPCVLHWDLDHFVVLKKVDKNRAVILDPAVGERKISLADLSKHFTGVALELMPVAGVKRRKSVPSITPSQLTGPILGLWRSLLQIGFLSAVLQIFVILAPFYMQWVVDQVLVSADKSLLTVLALGFGLLLLLQIGTGLLRGWSVAYLSARLGLQWMSNILGHLLKLPLEFFEKRHLGDITSRMSSVQAIQRTLTTTFVESFIDGFMAVVTLGLMIFYSWQLSILTLITVMLYFCIRAIAYRPVRDLAEEQLRASARQQTHLLESLRGIQSLKVAGKEPQRRATYDNLMVETINNDVKLGRLALGFGGASQLIFGAERITVIWIAALLTLNNLFSVGMLIAYLAYKEQFTQRMGSLIDKWIEFRIMRLHGERLADIVLTEPEFDRNFPQILPLTDVRIEVEKISFRYADDEPWVLRECSFVIGSGESVAIIGASGCGKSTLIKLMLGLLQPTEGVIRIGGHDMRKIGVKSLRSIVGAVMQDDQLFSGSIADNISFFSQEFDMTCIERAAQMAAVHEDIMAMPMGYHSLIGDMGSSLSGGQKQRLILARALYREPKLLFLDEATSHLDIARERLVNDAVSRLQLTKLIVAHRPETIASADRVLMLDEGRIIKDFENGGRGGVW